MNNRSSSIVSWIAQIVAVIIMGQTLFFKFSGAPESVQLFTELEMEPEGRVLIGILELVACILLLVPSSITFGAMLSSGLMMGAIIGHFTQLGWEGERFQLGMLAVVVLVACSIILFIRRHTIPLLGYALYERGSSTKTDGD
jgi:uncharacterized membrane protein YphA (DoxX/SURF4 family)